MAEGDALIKNWHHLLEHLYLSQSWRHQDAAVEKHSWSSGNGSAVPGSTFNLLGEL